MPVLGSFKIGDRLRLVLASSTREYIYDTLRPQLSSKARGLTNASPHEKKLIYVHVPKTGGYSISRSLRDAHALSDDAPHFLRHFTLQELWDQGVDLTNTEKYIVVVAVRNPYDRVHSMWRYRLVGSLRCGLGLALRHKRQAGSDGSAGGDSTTS